MLRLCLLLICLPLAAQETALQIRIIEGEGMGYAAGSRATRGVVVQVFDGAGRSVEGASVVFQLPADGPSGVFASGSRMELVATDADGRASVWGMKWNRIIGSLELRISASKGQARARASITCPLRLTEAEAEAKVGRSHHKIVWIGLAVAAGVAGAVVVRGSAPVAGVNGTSVAVNPPTFGAPTIAISHP